MLDIHCRQILYVIGEIFVPINVHVLNVRDKKFIVYNNLTCNQSLATFV